MRRFGGIFPLHGAVHKNKSDTPPNITFGHSVTAYSPFLDFGVQLREVFTNAFPCVSHQPTAFCRFAQKLLFPFTAFYYNVIINIPVLFVNHIFDILVNILVKRIPVFPMLLYIVHRFIRL